MCNSCLLAGGFQFYYIRKTNLQTLLESYLVFFNLREREKKKMEEILGLKKFLVLSILVFVGGGISSPVSAATRTFNWDIRYDYKYPDCYKKVAITINGGFPGPTITAVEGDTIIVEVTNSLLTENVAIHWHGIRQVSKSSFSLFPIYIYIYVHHAMMILVDWNSVG